MRVVEPFRDYKNDIKQMSPAVFSTP